ncbi:MAG TPA: Zn-dependent hydrolase [Thermoleophilaceae bacterium]|nr:Zn-dependent hydrolase [Thermoleophilaceae bacterium]
MEVRPERAIADLRELARRTGGPGGARRLCWTPVWQDARAFLRELLAAIDGVSVELDEAGNLWATLPGEGGGPGEGGRSGALAVGSHIDSVPNGGWLDGALGVMAGVELLRAAAEAGGVARTLTLIDFADEEGARFGRSLFGSSAVAGTLDPGAVRDLTDAEGRPIGEVLAEHGVELDRAPRAAARRDRIGTYLELHIEQGPVLESEDIAVAAVTGTFGVERHRFTYAGQASHAGTTPMEMRRDAGLAAARTALAVEEIAREHGGVGTTGVLRLEPGIPTAVPGGAELVVDLRHASAGALAEMLHAVRAAAADSADARDVAVSETEIWRIEPIPFDETLVEAALTAAGSGRRLPSGALHDAAEMARHVPTVMMFTSSTHGRSHAAEEDTPEEHLTAAIAAFGRLAAGLV